MLNFKKALVILPIGLFAIPVLTSCNGNSGGGSKDGTIYLKVLNSEDYIYKYDPDEGCTEPDLVVQFENEMKKEGLNVKVIYDTFDTMENMYNTLKTGKTKYDLICASEYMIQKLAREKVNGQPLIQKLDTSETGDISNYYQKYSYDNGGCSPYIRKKLQSIPVVAGRPLSEGSLDEYAMCYMWGTLGILYNPTYKTFVSRGISEETVHKDMNYWATLWDSKYNKTISIKDSMRDTYAIGVMHSFEDELRDAGELPDPEESFKKRNEIFNYGGEADKNYKEHINTVKNDLLKLRKNVFGFEVDSGKQDIVTGKIGIDTAWSGDAVYSMDQGDKEGSATLYYSIPEEGTNLWFDCWAMQTGANKTIANKFLNFISDPKNAIQNMDYIGYTSPIGGSDVYDYFQDEKYKPESGVTTTPYDVSYFFKDSTPEHSVVQFNIDEEIVDRQMAAQFPKGELESKLMIMQDYGEHNDLILRMWEQVKHESLPNWAIALLSVEGALAVGGVTIFAILKVSDKKRRKSRKAVGV